MKRKTYIQEALKAGEIIGVTIYQIKKSASTNKSILEKINSNEMPRVKESLENLFQLSNYQAIEDAYRNILETIQKEYSREGKFLEKKLTAAIEEYRTHHRKACEYLAWKN